MSKINSANIPTCMAALPQWVLWKIASRLGKPTKVPFQVNGQEAKSNDPITWTTLDTVLVRYATGDYDGIGFVFADGGGLVGVDLDGCRDSTTGKVADWAREIILKFDTYAEVSPSESGVKLFVLGKSPFDSGKKKELKTEVAVGGKSPGIECYDRGRYFAVTGLRLQGPREPQVRQIALGWLKGKYWPDDCRIASGDFHCESSVMERARKYLVKLPPAVSGSGGHKAAFHAACVLTLGFGLPREAGLSLLEEWNQTCQPPWSQRELEHKIDDAAKQSGERNYLRNVQPERWAQIKVPTYFSPPRKREPVQTTLVESAGNYLHRLLDGKGKLTETGLPDLDYAIGGGLEHGELVIMAGRPSHGKSAVALQCVHHWTSLGLPTLIISEEMSSLALGKRTIQFLSDVPNEHWETSAIKVARQIDEYAAMRTPCHVIESCGTVELAVDLIEKAIERYKIQVVVVDYAQLLRSSGKSRYEQTTNTSIALREVTNRHHLITLALCQLSRVIEGRPKFIPQLSDLKDTGQLEQDADVIVFLVWPHRIDSKNDPHVYQLFVGKNRNRAINSFALTCRFEPARQRVVLEKPGVSAGGYAPHGEFADFT